MKFTLPLVQSQFASPLGPITLAASAHGLAGLWFDGQRHLPAELLGDAPWPRDDAHPVLAAAAAQLADYFAGRRRQFDLPLDLSHGTPFQQSVWQALLKIDTGATASYGQISARVGRAQAMRAVGAAIGRNPISIIVPCHRVIGASGALTGYAGGIERKTALLQLEGALATPSGSAAIAASTTSNFHVEEFVA
jgi:methylated-DNA-[protein]-cysteine S-methyltransferase